MPGTWHRITHRIPNWRDALAEMLRVVKPGGYFVYSDLVLPSWLARTAEKLIHAAGFPAAEGLKEIAAQARFDRIYKSRAMVNYRAVYRKGH